MSEFDVLQTLTFLSNLTCDCDECEIPSDKSYKSPPPSKKLAFGYDVPLSHHSRLNPAQEQVPKIQKQKRTLLERDTVTGISLWKLLLPCDAIPLIELGYNHRIVYVQNVSPGTKISLVERAPDDLNHTKQPLTFWKENHAYYFPYSKDKYNVGSGLIVENTEEQQSLLLSGSKSDGKTSVLNTAKNDFCTVFIMKISPQKLDESHTVKDENNTSNSSLISQNRKTILKLFQKMKNLSNINKNTPENNSNIDKSKDDGIKNTNNDVNNDINTHVAENKDPSIAGSTNNPHNEYQGHMIEKYDTDLLKQICLSSSSS